MVAFPGLHPSSEGIPLVRQPQWGNFLNCRTRVLPVPTLSLAMEPDPMGTFTLVWASALAGARYILEEASQANFHGAVPLYTGPQNHLTLYGRSQGTYYYRVRAEVEGRHKRLVARGRCACGRGTPLAIAHGAGV